MRWSYHKSLPGKDPKKLSTANDVCKYVKKRLWRNSSLQIIQKIFYGRNSFRVQEILFENLNLNLFKMCQMLYISYDSHVLPLTLYHVILATGRWSVFVVAQHVRTYRGAFIYLSIWKTIVTRMKAITLFFVFKYFAATTVQVVKSVQYENLTFALWFSSFFFA